jgi:hypothetical protein
MSSFKAPYEIISCRGNAKDCRERLYIDYQDYFHLPYENIFRNSEDERQEEYWTDVEKVKIKIGKDYFHISQKIDNSIWIEKIEDKKLSEIQKIEEEKEI